MGKNTSEYSKAKLTRTCCVKRLSCPNLSVDLGVQFIDVINGWEHEVTMNDNVHQIPAC